MAVASRVLSLSPRCVPAQESKSAPLAKQLAAALDAAKLDSIAARDPVAPTHSSPRSISRCGAPRRVGQVLGAGAHRRSSSRRKYRDVYLDLNGASLVDSKLFIEDLGADGLQSKREENKPFDSVTNGGKRTMFDGEWKEQKLSEQDYLKAFAAADERYAQILTALLAQLKKTS